jgi:S1-C subfamily serine protease
MQQTLRVYAVDARRGQRLVGRHSIVPRLLAACCVLLAIFPPARAPAAAPEDTVAAAPADAPIAPPGVENAIVKVFSTIRYPDPYRPWTKQSPTEVSGTGVVIGGKRILTNAHVVAYASQVQIQANQAGDKLSAKVVATAPGIDLAVLELDDPSFFDTHAPIARANELPPIKDAVLAYGFPTGGNSLSITKGIVSRIEFVPYSYSVSGLRIQIDAPINPGNSGGPAMAGDRMIGLAFSYLGNAQNIGYIIPEEEIELFLQDIADGHYDGKPAIHDDLQTLENPALREFLKLDKSVEGIVVHRPRLAEPGYPLHEWDVITGIAGEPIDDQGMIRIGSSLRVKFEYLVQSRSRAGKIPLTIVRAGKTLQIDLPVESDRPLLVPDLHGGYPPYFIYGPIAFTPVTWEFAAGVMSKPGLATGLSIAGSPLVTRRSEAPSAEREELVVVCAPFFPNALVKGYGEHTGAVLQSVNGIRIRSLRHLVTVLREMQSEFVDLHFEQSGGEDIILRHKAVLAATEEILSDNGVRAQASPELLEVWKARAGRAK